MCGLFGFKVGKGFNRQRELYSILAYFMSYRGTDSFGVSISGPGGVITVRGLGDISNATKTRDKIPGCEAVLGHTRYATTGDITIENCHPFRIKRSLVAHNGVIYNYREAERKDGRTYTVDSQALAWRVALQQPADDLFGYGSVSFMDAKTGALQIARMSGGELEGFRVFDKENGGHAVCYVSSLTSGTWRVPTGDRLTLAETLERFGFAISERYEIETGTVYRVTAGGLRATKREIDLGSSYGSRYDSYGWRDDQDEEWREYLAKRYPHWRSYSEPTRNRADGIWRCGPAGWAFEEYDSGGYSIDPETGEVTGGE